MDIITRISDPTWWLDKITNDLYFLNRNVLQVLEDPTIGLKDLYRPTHKRICDFITQYAIPGNYCLLLCPRFWLKSYLCTAGFPLQRLIKNWRSGVRDHIIINNATIPNAKELLWRIKYNLLYNDFLRGILMTIPAIVSEIADPENKAERWTQDEIQIYGNRIETGSAESNLVSRHYKIIINDDLVDRENSRTREQLSKTIEWWKLARSLLHPTGTEITIGTRWSFDDLYGFMLDKFLKPPKDYAQGKPIIEFHRGKFHLLQMDCYEDTELETGSTFPILFPEARLKELAEEQGDEFFGQMRNDPLKKGKNKFKREDFHYYNGIVDIPQVSTTTMLLDITDKDKKTSDFTGMVIVDFASDKVGYIRKGERRRVVDSALIDWMIEEFILYQPDRIGIESLKYNTIIELMELVIPQKVRRGEIPPEYIPMVRNLPYLCYELRHRGRPKYIRIENMHGYVTKGIIKFPHDGADHLIDELIRLRSSSIDDTADAFGYIFDVMEFPKPTDEPRVLIVPDYLKKTDMEKEQEEWDKIKRGVFLTGMPSEPDMEEDFWEEEL